MIFKHLARKRPGMAVEKVARVKKYYFPSIILNFRIRNSLKRFFKKLLPSIFSSGVTQINILVGTIIASFQASAVSYLYYADRIYQINLAIAGIAIGTVILPNLSRYIKSRKIINPCIIVLLAFICNR